MKILIDFSQIPIEKVGVGVYAMKMTEQLLKFDLHDEIIILAQNDDKDIDRFVQSNVLIKKVNAFMFRRLLFRVLLEQFYIPFLLLKYNVDVIHSLHYSFPLMRFGTKNIVTIHDLTFFLFPGVHTLIKRLYFKTFIKLNANSRNEIICVSQSTADDLVGYFPSCKPRIHVVPLAVENIKVELPFFYVKQKFNLPNRYMLFIGTLEPRKNIVSLIRAYSLIADQVAMGLVIVGKKGWFYNSIFDEVRQSALETRVYFTGFVTDQEKYTILDNCEIFVYPSLYEGFGLPVLEALKLTKPVVTSNVSSMPEVAGNAALLINPESITEISESLLLLATDHELRDDLKNKARKQASLFNWENTARLTLKVYGDVRKIVN